MDLVYPPVVLAARAAFLALGMKLDVRGSEHVPRRGGAVLAINHVSYLDFIFGGFAAVKQRRLTRFMAKEVVFRHRVSGPLMRGMHHIPVDRAAGGASYRRAVEALRAGEVVGVFPEATISRSFELKAMKAGAARMAQEAGVPLVPVIVWGGQRMYTKDHPRRFPRGVTVSVRVGEPVPVPADAHPVEVTKVLQARMEALLHEVQAAYPDQPAGPDDTWWLPARLGGTAPTPEQALQLDRDEAAGKGRAPAG